MAGQKNGKAARKGSRAKIHELEMAGADKLAKLEADLAERDAEARINEGMAIALSPEQTQWLRLLRDLDNLHERIQNLPDGVVHPDHREALADHLDRATDELIYGRPTLATPIDTPTRCYL